MTENSVRDHFRRGKFKPDSGHPRPILVRLNRTSEVSVLLARRNCIESSIRLKPDLSAPDRARESTLLKERWNLIQTGVERSRINIFGTKVYVDRKLHGSFNDGKLELESQSSTGDNLPLEPSDHNLLSNRSAANLESNEHPVSSPNSPEHRPSTFTVPVEVHDPVTHQ